MLIFLKSEVKWVILCTATQRQISSSFDCVGELTAVYTVRRESPAGNVREPDHQVSDIDDKHRSWFECHL